MDIQPPILVLVTMQRACARLIRCGVDLSLQQHCPLHVLHIVSVDAAEKPEQTIDSRVLDYLYALSCEAGAYMTVLRAEVALTAIAKFAEQQGSKQIVMGGGEHAQGIAETLSSLLPNVEIMIVPETVESV